MAAKVVEPKCCKCHKVLTSKAVCLTCGHAVCACQVCTPGYEKNGPKARRRVYNKCSGAYVVASMGKTLS